MENNPEQNKEKVNKEAGAQKQGFNTVMKSDIRSEKQTGDQDFPGYPHYPASEDIMNPANNEGIVDMDIETLSRSRKVSDLSLEQPAPATDDEGAARPLLADLKDDEAEIGIVAGTEADLTEDDLIVLGSIDQDLDLGEDEEIKSRSGWPLETTGEDLDVPGSEDDDAAEEIGEEDEENNYYSLGGDDHQNLEEEQS